MTGMTIKLPDTLPRWLTSPTNWLGVLEFLSALIIAYQLNRTAGHLLLALRLITAAIRFLQTDAKPLPPEQPGPGQ